MEDDFFFFWVLVFKHHDMLMPNCDIKKYIFKLPAQVFAQQSETGWYDNKESHQQKIFFSLCKDVFTGVWSFARLLSASHVLYTECNQSFIYTERHPQATPAIFAPVS